MNKTVFRNAQWIWLDSDSLPDKNIFALFRTHFTVQSAEPVKLRISVAGNYAAYLNGKLAAFGQYTDYPHKKTYSETDISQCCMNGENELVCHVHFSGNDFTSHVDGSPGLIAEVIQGGKVLTESDTVWESCPDIRYAMGERDKLFCSLNYNFEFDANKKADHWTQSKVQPERNCTMRKRPAEPCSITGFISAREIRRGTLLRNPDFSGSTGECFNADLRDTDPSNGIYIVYDLGKEYTGLLEFELDAPADTLLDISFGEYLADGHIPQFPKWTNFVDRYIAGKGRQTFLHSLRRWGCRYLEIHAISGQPEKIKIHKLGLYHVQLGGMNTPDFVCSDQFWIKAHEVSAETLRLCLHEKYENCPWREQSICMYDARNQMLFGYPWWGNYNRAKAMLELFADGLRSDGFMPVAAASIKTLSIPSYTFLWFTALYEYTMYSGDLTLFQGYIPMIEGMFQKILGLKRNGFYIPPAEGLWNYCEAPELEFCADPPNAFYNLYLAEALGNIAEMYRLCGNAVRAGELSELAKDLGLRAEEYYYDGTMEAYADCIAENGKKDVFHGHIQSLFLALGLVPQKKIAAIMEKIRNNTLHFPALGALIYLVKGVFRYGSAEDRQWMFRKICEHYGSMLDAGAETWWEVSIGSQYGGGAGSLCHGWSAMPAWYESSVLLGAAPLEPGYKKFRLKPYAGNILSADGSIVTPYGSIRICWTKEKDGLHLNVQTPAQCIPVLSSYPEEPVARFRLNGIEQAI